MDLYRFMCDPEKGKFSGSKKFSTSVKDVKRKMSSINKRINDLHHQKKLVYKNSVKVKKMIHNQINQIVKCFRARERSICCDVDDVYCSQDANISDELSKLQSAYAHCQALFNHIEDFKDKSNILRNIDITLSGINFGEKSDAKPLEFLSDFEMMKVKASSYGYLEGDFVKKDDFVYVGEEKDSKLCGDNCKLFQNKEFPNNICSALKNDAIISTQGSSLYKTSDSDDFQIIDLLDNMNCHDIDTDFVMDEDVNPNCSSQTENKLSELSSGRRESTFKIKECNMLKSFSESCETNIDFNPEEEWQHILEMNKKIASWHGVTSKETVNDPKEKEKSCDKNCKPYKFLQSKEANNWLYNSKKCNLGIEETSGKITKEMNLMSPAEIIQKSFKSYLAKDNIQNWLSTH